MTATGARPSPAAAGSTLAVGTMLRSAWAEAWREFADGDRTIERAFCAALDERWAIPAGSARADGRFGTAIIEHTTFACGPRSRSAPRERLGSERVRALFERVAVQLAAPGTPGCWLAGRRMVAIDGMTLDVADSEVNYAEFGRPGVNKGEKSAFPQARVVAVAECGTRAIFDAVVGPYTTGENTLAIELVERLEPGMVLLADRGFCGYPLWHKAQATGADLLWRAKSNMNLRHVETWLTAHGSANSARAATPAVTPPRIGCG